MPASYCLSLTAVICCHYQPAAAFKLKCVKCSRLDGAKLQSVNRRTEEGSTAMLKFLIVSSIAPADSLCRVTWCHLLLLLLL